MIRQMTSSLGINAEIGSQSNATPRSRRRNKKRAQYFVLGNKGIARRVSGGGLEPFIWFISAPNYQTRLDFFGLSNRIVNENIENEFDKAINYAIRTARIAIG